MSNYKFISISDSLYMLYCKLKKFLFKQAHLWNIKLCLHLTFSASLRCGLCTRKYQIRTTFNSDEYCVHTVCILVSLYKTI